MLEYDDRTLEFPEPQSSSPLVLSDPRKLCEDHLCHAVEVVQVDFPQPTLGSDESGAQP